MDCLVCRGACCEEVEVPLAPRLDPFVSEWLRARGMLKGAPGYPTVRLDARCPHLTPEGRCAVHCIAKPVLCASAKAGDPWCLDVVRRRRTPEQYQAIRGPHDPEVL